LKNPVKPYHATPRSDLDLDPCLSAGGNIQLPRSNCARRNVAPDEQPAAFGILSCLTSR
jgi:hypothetical protein